MEKISMQKQYKLITEDNSTLEEKIDYLKYLLTTIPDSKKEDKLEIQEIIKKLEQEKTHD